MALPTQPYKGTRDFYPEELSIRRKIFNQFREICRNFSFSEYDGPLLEPLEIYAAKTGEEIVNQQLYSFEDRGGRRVAIRPEMTPTLARMVAARIGELSLPLKWFSFPNLYRYERPQKGRLREHWQLNVDIIGGEPALADLEILELITALFDSFSCSDKISIRINHRAWVNFYFSDIMGLDAVESLRCSKLVDAKEKLAPEAFQAGLAELKFSSAQKRAFEDYLGLGIVDMCKRHPDSPLIHVQSLLERLGRADVFSYDPCIMRGLDYYTGVVFEGFDRSPSNRRALFGGGRYDKLISLFGKQEISGIGFGMGDVVLWDFLSDNGALPSADRGCDFFVSLPSDDFWKEASAFLRVLRLRKYSTQMSLKSGNFKQQLKAADRSGASFALLFGEEEWKEKKVIVRNMKNSSQEILSLSEISVKDFF